MSTKEKEAPRTYTMSFEDGKTVTKTADELSLEQIATLEKVAALSNEIQRLSNLVNDNIILRDYYQKSILSVFEDTKEKEE